MFKKFKPEDQFGNRCHCWAVIEVKGPRHRLCKGHKAKALRKVRSERAKGFESFAKWLDK